MDAQTQIPVTLCFTKASLTSGTTSTISTTGTTTYAIRGKFYTKTAITNGATPTTDWSTGNAFLGVLKNNGSVYTVGFDKSGNIKVVQGTINPLDTSGNFVTAPMFGGLGPAGSTSTNNDFCMIGYIVIQAGSTADNVTGFILGTTSWTATGITATFVDCCGEPDRPQTS